MAKSKYFAFSICFSPMVPWLNQLFDVVAFSVLHNLHHWATSQFTSFDILVLLHYLRDGSGKGYYWCCQPEKPHDITTLWFSKVVNDHPKMIMIWWLFKQVFRYFRQIASPTKSNLIGLIRSTNLCTIYAYKPKIY